MVGASAETLLGPVQQWFRPLRLKVCIYWAKGKHRLSIHNSEANYVNNSAVWEEKQGSLGQKTGCQIVQTFTGYQHSIALRVRKEFKDELKDLLQEVIFENYSYYCFLVCFVYCHCVISSLLSVIILIVLI